MVGVSLRGWRRKRWKDKKRGGELFGHLEKAE